MVVRTRTQAFYKSKLREEYSPTTKGGVKGSPRMPMACVIRSISRKKDRFPHVKR